VHRDVKPANVMLDLTDPTRPIALLTDFGVARLISAGVITHTGHLLGTPLYMAPELIRNDDVTPAADLYSVGVLLYELLTGQPPFVPRDDISTVFRAHLETMPAPPAGVPAPLSSVVLRLLAKSPADRPSDAAAAEHDLRQAAIVGSYPVEASQITVTGALAPPPAPRLPTPLPSALPTPRSSVRRVVVSSALALLIGTGASLTYYLVHDTSTDSLRAATLKGASSNPTSSATSKVVNATKTAREWRAWAHGGFEKTWPDTFEALTGTGFAGDDVGSRVSPLPGLGLITSDGTGCAAAVQRLSADDVEVASVSWNFVATESPTPAQLRVALFATPADSLVYWQHLSTYLNTCIGAAADTRTGTIEGRPVSFRRTFYRAVVPDAIVARYRVQDPTFRARAQPRTGTAPTQAIVAARRGLAVITVDDSDDQLSAHAMVSLAAGLQP
jgi:hypothetical protein